MAFLSYWDAGVILLDISDPTHPTFVGRTIYPRGAAGDTHSIALAQDENLLLICDEDFSPEFGPQPPPPDDTWGFLRLWDIRNLTNPVQVGTFATPNSVSNRNDAEYSIHNAVVQNNLAYLSWYSDGVRVVGISLPNAPVEIASFVPPPTKDPYGVFPTAAEVWGVYVDSSVVLLSDINAGLYVLKYGDITRVEERPSVITSLALQQNYPNPFNPATEIRFQNPEATHVVLKIFNTLGEEIRTLVNAEYAAGSHAVRWDGQNQRGEKVASGVYLYRLEAGSFIDTKKMVLLP